MVVYADILIILNLIVDYFLLLATAKLLKIKSIVWRLILSAAEGALFSLYIFAPSSPFITELAIRLIVNFIMVVTAFGFGSLKMFLKSSAVFFTVTYVFGGFMICVWQLWRPQGMVINNSVVYFNISPVVLIVSSAAAYLVFLVCNRVFARSSQYAQHCEITVFADGKKIQANAIIDTGNSISDVFGKSEIIIVDKAVLIALFGDIDITLNKELCSRYRAVPCGTVSGDDVLDGYRCDSAEIILEKTTLIIEKPILALSKIKLCDGYTAILNPKILNYTGEDDVAKNKKLSV